MKNGGFPISYVNLPEGKWLKNGSTLQKFQTYLNLCMIVWLQASAKRW